MFNSFLMLIGLGIYELFKFLKRQVVWIPLLVVIWLVRHYDLIEKARPLFRQCNTSGGNVVLIIGCVLAGIALGSLFTGIIMASRDRSKIRAEYQRAYEARHY